MHPGKIAAIASGLVVAMFIGWRGYQYHEHLGEQEKQAARAAAADAAIAQRNVENAARAREEFAKNRATILSDLRALERAGKWPEAQSALAKHQGIADPELEQLASKIRAGAAAAERKKAADAKAAADKSDLAKRRKEGINIGMTREDVLKSNWGRPERVNTTVTTRGTREQWVYGGSQYLYFDNGILTAVQQSK